MSMPPQQGPWGPGAPPPPGPQQPPQGYYPQPGWGPPAPPPQQPNNNVTKWLAGVAVLLVIAITVGVTLLVTRDGDGNGGPTGTTSPNTNGDIASADDTGPVEIITADPTCEGWRSIARELADSQNKGWAQRDTSTPAAEWSTEQRTQFEAVGEAMRTAAGQSLALAEQTPHRVMRELFGQFSAYGRAYADSLPTYVDDDDFYAQANVSASSAISAICEAITFGSVLTKLDNVPSAGDPAAVAEIGDLASPQLFVTEVDRSCADWIENAARFEADLVNWTALDPNIPATQWTAEQRIVQENAAKIFRDQADKMVRVGRGSANPIFADLAELGALYFYVYADSTPTYTVADNFISLPGLRINNLLTAACQGAA